MVTMVYLAISTDVLVVPQIRPFRLRVHNMIYMMRMWRASKLPVIDHAKPLLSISDLLSGLLRRQSVGEACLAAGAIPFLNCDTKVLAHLALQCLFLLPRHDQWPGTG